jgi:hypothetical protein
MNYRKQKDAWTCLPAARDHSATTATPSPKMEQYGTNTRNNTNPVVSPTKTTRRTKLSITSTYQEAAVLYKQQSQLQERKNDDDDDDDDDAYETAVLNDGTSSYKKNKNNKGNGGRRSGLLMKKQNSISRLMGKGKEVLRRKAQNAKIRGTSV